MKKIISMVLVMSSVLLVGCFESESQKVSHNLSEEADNFNVVRQLTVINCLQGDTLF